MNLYHAGGNVSRSPRRVGGRGIRGHASYGPATLGGAKYSNTLSTSPVFKSQELHARSYRGTRAKVSLKFMLLLFTPYTVDSKEKH